MSTIEKQKPKSKYGSIVGKIAPVAKPTSGFKMLIYGRSGTGKTTVACDFPKPLLIIGAEDGTKSIYNVPGVEFVRVKTPEEIGDLIFYQRKERKFKTVVLDCATSQQELVLKKLLRENGLLEEDEELPAQLGYGEVPREVWNELSAIMKSQLQEFLDLGDAGTHALLLAQERAFDNEGDSSDLIIPSVMAGVSPSVASWLNPQCDYIGQTLIRRQRVKEKVRVKKGNKVVLKDKMVEKNLFCLRVGPDPVYATKFRKPKGSSLPDVIVDPTFDKIAQLT